MDNSANTDCFSSLGRNLVYYFGFSPQYILDLCSIYREIKRPAGAKRPEWPWRFHRRLLRILGSSRSRDFQKARASLITDLVGKNPANLKLRPSGRVALEWARLSTEGPQGN
jgi:hypothetical protein